MKSPYGCFSYEPVLFLGALIAVSMMATKRNIEIGKPQCHQSILATSYVI